MTQCDLNQAMAKATGESLNLVSPFGFQLADPLDVDHDPEPRQPLVLDWDSMCAVDYPSF